MRKNDCLRWAKALINGKHQKLTGRMSGLIETQNKVRKIEALKDGEVREHVLINLLKAQLLIMLTNNEVLYRKLITKLREIDSIKHIVYIQAEKSVQNYLVGL